MAGIRDAAHYRRMMDEGPDTTIGASLAAAAIYAARYGVCEAEDRGSAAYRQLLRGLMARYGESLSNSEVVVEMETPQTELIAAADIAQMPTTPVTVGAVHQWAKRHPEFRALATETSAGLIWQRGAVVEWLRGTGRL
jgi:hypothetical protein